MASRVVKRFDKKILIINTIFWVMTKRTTRRSTIFLELFYGKTFLLPHDLDVINIERSVLLNILYIVMDTKEKMKNTLKSRMGVEVHFKWGLKVKPSRNDNIVKPKV